MQSCRPHDLRPFSTAHLICSYKEFWRSFLKLCVLEKCSNRDNDFRDKLPGRAEGGAGTCPTIVSVHFLLLVRRGPVDSSGVELSEH
jgi:hypothetical protein